MARIRGRTDAPFAALLLLALPAAQVSSFSRGDLAFTGSNALPGLLQGSINKAACRRSGAALLQASSMDFRQGSGGLRIDDFRQSSAVPSFRPSAVTKAPPVPPRSLPVGSLREQRDKMNSMHLEREAWYDMMKRRVRASSYQDGSQDIRRLFSQFDTNKNGVLDATEYRTLLMRMGMRPFGITDDDLRILFHEMGSSGRGLEIRAREFFAWFSGGYQAGGAVPQLNGPTQAVAHEGVDRFAGTASLAGDNAGWTYGESTESIWWDEGPETRVLKTLELANTQAGSTAASVRTEATRLPAQHPVSAGVADGLASVSTSSVAKDMRVQGVEDSMQELLAEVEPWTQTTPDKLHAAIYYLVNEIGLPPSKVKALALETPGVFDLEVDEHLRPRIDALRAMGVPVSKISKLLSAVPDILDAGSWDKRQDALMFLSTLGIPEDKLGQCIARHPRLLDMSIETMSLVVEFLVAVARIPRSKVSKIVEAMPSLLSHSVHLNLQPKLLFLVEDVGISPERLAPLLLKFPQVLGLSVEGNLRPTVRYLTDELGVAHDNLARILSNVPQLLGLSVDGNLKVKVNYLVSELGIPHERLADILNKSPTLFSLSVEKNLQPKVQFLVKEAGYSVEEIIKTPNVLAYSIDRIRMRHKFLSEKGLKLGLSSMVSYSTAEFQKRFDHDGDLL